MCSKQCENLNLDLSRLSKRQNFFFQNFLIAVLFIVITFSYAGDSDFALSVKGVSVSTEDLQVYLYLLQTEHFTCMSCLKLVFSFIILLFPYGFFFHPMTASWKSVCDSFPLIPAVPLVGGVSVFFIRRISRKLIETQIFDMKSCFLGCQFFITN